MSGELHRRAREVFLAVIERPEVERAEALSALCGDDEALRAEVASLLPHHEERPASDVGPDAPAGSRLAAGAVFAGRYRVIECIGRGGMGEVYRVHDDVLDVVVALKLLRAADPAGRARLLNEVKLARAVTHPSVCRVFDVGFAGDEAFFTMEYVAGEDLGALLRRIGRLSADKVIDVARHLCGALAAAHARGVLHRDLKPTNVLIDRDGRVRITDFGIAISSDRATAGGVAGTPGYMAPEQMRRGAMVDERTDVYALGLLLYELLSGASAFADASLPALVRRQLEGPPEPLSHRVSGVPPGLEVAIMRALEPDPDRRPAGALAFAALLPGTDALAIAAQAGLTPAPELVAGAATGPAMTRRARRLLLAAAIVALAVTADLADDEAGYSRSAPPAAPAVLEERAKAMARDLGWPPTGRGNASGLTADATAPASAPGVLYWYRELAPASHPPLLDELLLADAGLVPEALESGGLVIELDRRERLRLLLRRPLATDGAVVGGSSGVEWDRVLARAGLDTTLLAPVAPPPAPLPVDEVRAWEGRTPEGEEVRVEAAGAGGRPVYFAVAPRPREDERTLSAASRAAAARTLWLIMPLLLVLLVSAAWLARRNLRAGRADARAAQRLAALMLVLALVHLLLAPPSHPLQHEPLRFFLGLLGALLIGLATWLGYLALEPSARRAWPRALVAWSRLLRGEAGDDSVAAAVLIGAAAGAVWALAVTAAAALAGGAGTALLPHPAERLATALSWQATATVVLGAALGAAGEGIIKLLLLSLLRLALRVPAAALAGFVVIDAALRIAPRPAGWAGIVLAVLGAAATAFLLLRFGLLAFVVTTFCQTLLLSFPLTDKGSSWFAGAGGFALLVVAALAVVASRRLVAVTTAVRVPA